MKGRRIKRTTKRNSKPNPWFVETYREASNAFCKEAIPPIASPIFDVQNNFEFGVENEVFFKTKFPFHQKIRGDGACYFNACLAGILNKCVNNPQRWNQFRQNLINKDCREIADQIGEEGETLARQKVNELLQVRGDANIVRQLSKKLLVPMHTAFILDKEKLIAEQSERLNFLAENSEERINALRAIQIYQAGINLYDTNDIANIYYESDVSPIVDELANSLNLDFQTLSKEIVEGINDEIASVINFDNPNAIFLWNPGGGAHFDLLYSHADENLQKDVDEARGVSAKNPKPSALSEEQSQKVEKYLKGKILDEDQEFVNMLKDLGSANSEQEKIFLFDIIQNYEASKALVQKTNFENTEELTKEDQESLGKFATAHIRSVISGINTEKDQEFIRLAKLSLAFDGRNDFKNRGLIIEAALYGKSEFIPLLHKAGEDFSKKDSLGFDNTALIWAIANAHNKFAYDLLTFAQENDINLEVNHRSALFTTALHLAAAKGYSTQDSNGKTVEKSNLELVKKLFEVGADPNFKTDKNFTSLDIAVARRDLEIVRAICESEIIDINTLDQAQKTLRYNFNESKNLVESVTRAISPISEHLFNDENLKADIEKNIIDKIKEIQNDLISNPPVEISNYSKWEFINKSEKITPAESTPDTKIEVISATPVITNQKSVWFNDDGRGNKFRVITGVYGIETDNPQIEIGQTFIGILQKLAAEENLTKDQVLEIIELSKIKGGVSNKYDLATQKYSENDESENVADLKTAQIFSRKFQRECEKCGIYTGREGENVKMVGLRLTFIPDDVVDAYKTDNIPDFAHTINSVKERVSQKISSQQH